MLAGDRVPMFKLRPYRGLLLAALFVLVVGGLLSAYFYDDGLVTGSRTWLFVLLVTLIFALFLVMAAFSRFGFKHLWHHRPGYKRG